MNNPEVQEIIDEQKNKKRAKLLKMRETTDILNLPYK